MPRNDTIYNVALAAGTGALTFDASLGFTSIQITASAGVTLASNFSVTTSGTPIERDSYDIFIYINGALDLNGNSFSVLGKSLDQDLLNSGAIRMYAVYLSGNWRVSTLPDFTGTGFIESSHIKDGTIATADIADDAVTLTKLVNVTRGSLIVGGVANAPTERDFKTSGQIPIGDGTDINSVAITGDATLSSSGVLEIAAGAIDPDHLSFSLGDQVLEASLSLSSAQILALNTTPQTIVASPGSGKYIEVVSASTDMNFVTAAYAVNTTLQLINEGATIAQLQDTAALIATVDKVTKFSSVTAATAGQTQIIKNSALQVKVATGDPTTGDGTMVVRVLYRIVG